MISPLSLPKKAINSATFNDFMKPVHEILPNIPALESEGDRPLKFLFENQLDSLISCSTVVGSFFS